MSLYEKKRNNQPAEEEKNAENRLNAKTRACTWLMLSVAVFLCAIIACGALIAKSARSGKEQKVQEVHIEDIKYVANNTDDPNAAGISNGEVVDEQKLTAPESVYDSAMLNILLVGYDEKTEQTDAMIVVSVDMERGLPSMLSIPRDTYIAGDYEMPKINRVYAANGERGIDALKEAVENMLGFRLDKYVVFDAESLAEILELTDGVRFEIPEEPMYHTLSSGEQIFKDEEAFELFRYNDEYTDVETEPYFVQRDFLAKILDTLLKDQENKLENAEVICNAVQTDLLTTELAYLTELLKNARFEAAFSRALPGEEITINDVSFYQVEPAEASELLNGHFNPTGKDLTEYDVHFRQLQGDSGEGEMPEYGFGGPHPTTNPDLTESPDEPTEATEEETGENTEENTENETSEPTESTGEEIPYEPTESDGDE